MILNAVDGEEAEAEVLFKDLIKAYLPKLNEGFLSFSTVATNIERVFHTFSANLRNTSFGICPQLKYKLRISVIHFLHFICNSTNE